MSTRVPPSTAALLPTLRAQELKRLAFLCGIPATASTKPVLVERLLHAAIRGSSSSSSSGKSRGTPPPAASGPCILSIDLGIRNLAYSLVTPAPTAGSGTPGAKATRTRKSAKSSETGTVVDDDATRPPNVRVHLWRRQDLTLSEAKSPLLLLPRASPAPDADADADADAEAEAGIEDDNDEPAGGGGGGDDGLVAADRFSPARLAVTASDFVLGTVLRLDPPPTHVLLERQRFRSRGAAAVQEWTLRVNTLEAMLHAALRVLRALGRWRGEVESVSPAGVAAFWLEADKYAVSGDGEGRARSGKMDNKMKKKLKIDVLRGWLDQPADDGPIVSAGDHVDGMIDSFQAGREKKADDLADSLLQGMAWIRWEENKAMLAQEGGVEKLLNLQGASGLTNKRRGGKAGAP
ncbi:mitochondrial resolvase Ydc2 [Xylariaceae sp. FL0804]|nr:mitochondrial resolvase Ydc2 [Xylariaceae sp. FL0804]